MTEETKTIEVPEKFKSLVEGIEKLSVVDLAELVKLLEEKFGVSAAAPVAVAAAPAEGDGEATEEKSSFNVELTKVGDQKIEVIKIVRDTTGKGLKEAKDLVDAAVAAPQMVSEGLNKEDSDALKKRFTDVGATVELK